MLRTRLWMGAILIGLTIGALVVDQWVPRWYPFLFGVIFGLSLAGCVELLTLLDPARRPPRWLCLTGVAALVVANWPAHVGAGDWGPWPWIAGTFAAVVLASFLVEMANFREPGDSVLRIALTIFIVAYLGLLPSFIAQLRWMPPPAMYSGAYAGTIALALAIFVPKLCDTGAYFTGRFLGRHRMTPTLSPKKTWEGAIGGHVVAVLGTLGINSLGPVIPGGILGAIGFGLSVGLAGMLGDLAESLIKRDCRRKDASQAMPGFGGILDVVDSIVFAAPVAYAWLVLGNAIAPR